MADTVKVGEPFNPEVFGRMISQLVYGFLMEGGPLVDARGSGFDPDTGRLRIILVEPLVTRVEARTPAGSWVDEAHLLRLLGPLEGHPFRPDELQKRIALAEHRLAAVRIAALAPCGPQAGLGPAGLSRVGGPWRRALWWSRRPRP